MANRAVNISSDIDTQTRDRVSAVDVSRSTRSGPDRGSEAPRGGQVRLASVDLVTAAAVVGSVDMMASGDVAFPGLTASLANPGGDGSDLAEADLDALMGLTVSSRHAGSGAAVQDLFDLELEQLLAIEVFGVDQPPNDLTLLAFEDLIEVDVVEDVPEPLDRVIDLTEIALETLQDIQFGEQIRAPATAYRLVASLDLHSALDVAGANEITLVARSADPLAGGTSDYVAGPPAPPAADNAGREPPAAAIANRPPTVRDEALNTLQDTAMTANVLANDSDPDGDPLTIANAGTFASAMAGIVALNADGSFTYAPPSGYWGIDSFGYDVSDGQGNMASGVASIDVAKVNLGPVATDDSVTTDEDAALVIDATANDSDPDGDPLSIESVTQGAHGTVALNFDGTLTYTPDPNFNGTDTFTYTVSDPSGARATATVTVAVAPVNDTPYAKDDAVSGPEDSVLSGNVLDNDSDPDGDALTVTSTGPLTTAEGGSVVMAADGSFTYTPAANFHGADSFLYTITDGNGGTATATVGITVSPVNDAPVANTDAIAGLEDSSVSGNVLTNDTDPDGDTLMVTSTGTLTTGKGGTVVMAADGSFVYTPAANYNGPDSFLYTITDGNGGTATATVGITVSPVNDAPVANTDAIAGLEDSSVSGNVLTNDTDPDGDALTVTSTGTLTTGKGGTVVMAADGSFVYTPAANYNGPDSFLYTISDGNGGTATATVGITVSPVNDAPVANTDGISGLEDSSVTGSVLTNDTDPDGDALTVTSTGTLTTGKGGTVVMAADGSFVYTPAANYNGPDSFLYTISDGNGGTATARVGITVAPVNDAPFAGNDSFAGNEDTTVSGNVLTNDIDPDGDVLTVASTGAQSTAEGGTVVVNADGSFTYTPPADFHGLDSFTYRVSDGNGGTATATAEIAVAPVNDAPVAVDDAYTAPPGIEIRGNLLDNDRDPDGDPLAVTTTGLFGTGIGGQVQIADDGTFAYRAPASFAGTDTFTYTVTDGAGGTATATVTIDVVPSNTDPVAVNDAYDVAVDGNVTGNILANDSDADGDPLTVTGAGTRTTPGGGTISLMADGSFDYKPKAGFVGSESLTYEISDGRGGTANASITFSVTAGVSLNGTPNADRLIGTVADDVIDANGGDDLLIGLGGGDILAGGAGIDTVSYEDSSAAVQISLESGTAFGGDAEGDVLTGIENVIGSAFNDYIRGDTGDNVLWGGAGDDELLGYVGDDVFMGGPGADRHMGGDGVNRIDYSASDAAVDVNIDLERGLGGHAEGDYIEKTDNVTGSAFNDMLVGDRDVNVLDGGAGNDILSGAAGNDVLIGGDGDDLLDGGTGDDTLIGGAGADTLTGGAGIDQVDYSGSNAGIDVDLFTEDGFGGHAEGDFLEQVEDVIGSAFNDEIAGDIGTNTLHGGAGDDLLWGGEGNDFLFGGAGNDTLDGESGDDVFNGGLGNDTLLADLGRETFVFDAGTGSDVDTIENFASGEDVIDLSALGYVAFSDVSIATDGLGGSVITLSSGDTILVLNVDPSALMPTDVII